MNWRKVNDLEHLMFADVTFQCLGQWAGPGDQHYLALRDTRPEMNRFPPYRCAVSTTQIELSTAGWGGGGSEYPGSSVVFLGKKKCLFVSVHYV
jgi:hypothetical protein